MDSLFEDLGVVIQKIAPLTYYGLARHNSDNDAVKMIFKEAQYFLFTERWEIINVV